MRDSSYGVRQLLAVRIFDEISVRARFEGVVYAVWMDCHEYDAHGGRSRLDLAGDCHAVQRGHLRIDQRHVRRRRLDAPNGIESIGQQRKDFDVAHVSQDGCDSVQNGLAVVYDEDSNRLGSSQFVTTGIGYTFIIASIGALAMEISSPFAPITA